MASTSCRVTPEVPPRGVTTWGTLMEVLRMGQSQGRVPLARIANPNTVGVGALAGLEGEVTILDGRTLVATARGRDDREGSPPRVRQAGPGDAAALLVLADVERWEEFPIESFDSYADLDDVIARQLRERGHPLTEPIPVRVRGLARKVDFHVIAGACPIANPSGPPPWRGQLTSGPVDLVGFFVEGAAGRLTHHTPRSHLHVVAGDQTGHLDDAALDEATLCLPARRSVGVRRDNLPGGVSRSGATR